jgi:hypothetical protein
MRYVKCDAHIVFWWLGNCGFAFCEKKHSLIQPLQQSGGTNPANGETETIDKPTGETKIDALTITKDTWLKLKSNCHLN